MNTLTPQMAAMLANASYLIRKPTDTGYKLGVLPPYNTNTTAPFPSFF